MTAVEQVVPGDPRILAPRQDPFAEVLGTEPSALEEVAAERGLPELDRGARDQVLGLDAIEAR